MTTAELALGYDTVKHLDAWLAHNLDNDEAWLVRDAMLRLAAGDDGWLDRGWWRVYDEARCYA
jgi:hypothetical protein